MQISESDHLLHMYLNYLSAGKAHVARNSRAVVVTIYDEIMTFGLARDGFINSIV
ncbi:hypothetical protein D9M68_734790 [compost metagenome]